MSRDVTALQCPCLRTKVTHFFRVSEGNATRSDNLSRTGLPVNYAEPLSR